MINSGDHKSGYAMEANTMSEKRGGENNNNSG
jgi:hypothetical protein